MLLFDFSTERAIDAWTPINDGVMGGLSAGRFQASGRGSAEFSGVVSLENNGGFASVSSRPRDCALGGFSGLELRIRGDGRRYKISLNTGSKVNGLVYGTRFTSLQDDWQTRRIPFEEFLPMFRGRIVEAAHLDPARVSSLCVTISERQAGSFGLEISWIGAYLASPVPTFT